MGCHPCVNDDNEEASRKSFTKTIFKNAKTRRVHHAITTRRADAESDRFCVSTTPQYTKGHRSFDTPGPRRWSWFLRFDTPKHAKGHRSCDHDTPQPNAQTHRSSFMRSRHAQTTQRVIAFAFRQRKTRRGLAFLQFETSETSITSSV